MSKPTYYLSGSQLDALRHYEQKAAFMSSDQLHKQLKGSAFSVEALKVMSYGTAIHSALEAILTNDMSLLTEFTVNANKTIIPVVDNNLLKVASILKDKEGILVEQAYKRILYMPEYTVILTGLIDVVYTEDGTRTVLDWKTTTGTTNWPNAYRGSYQGVAYAFLANASRSEFCKIPISVHDEQPDRAYVYATGDYDLSVNNYDSVTLELANIIDRLIDFCKDKPDVLNRFRTKPRGSRYTGKNFKGSSPVSVYNENGVMCIGA